MIRRDGRTTTEADSALRDNHDVHDLWCINPWLTSHMIGAAHSQRIDAAEQERGRAMFAALGERLAAATVETGRRSRASRRDRLVEDDVLAGARVTRGQFLGRERPDLFADAN
jgi:hypothetical protein